MTTSTIVAGIAVILILTILVLFLRAFLLARMRRRSLQAQRDALARSVAASESERRRRARRANRRANRSESTLDLESGLQRPATAHLADGEDLPAYELPPTYESLKFPLPAEERVDGQQQNVEMSSSSTAPPVVPVATAPATRESLPPHYQEGHEARPSTPRQPSPPPQSNSANSSPSSRSIPPYRSLLSPA